MQAKSTMKALLAFMAVSLGMYSYAPPAKRSESDTARRPNILLIIADDVGMDVTTDMYPGLIDDLVAKYSFMSESDQ